MSSSSDDAYGSFLDQANQDTGASKDSAQSQSKKASTQAVNAEIPQALKSVKQTLASESDEPFEPVSLKWDKKTFPDEGGFGKLIAHDGEVCSMTTKEFDPQGKYGDVLELVGGEGKGTKVFKVQHGSTRAEIYIVSLNTDKGHIVGLKALSVES